MKLLILGANGMAGHLIAHYFIEKKYDVTIFSMVPVPIGKNIVGDVLKINDLDEFFNFNNYDIIINCIGILVKDSNENRSKAVFLNSYLPHLIADTIKDSKTKLIHMSTDCVFEGNSGPYNEKSYPDGNLFYDRTKALGEVIDSKNLTFRNSIVGPDMNPNGAGLFNWFMKQKNTVNGFRNSIWTGVTTLTLAKAMEEGIRQNLSGLYNLVNNDTINKYELLRLFNKHFKNNFVNIVPINNPVLDKTLICERKDFHFQIPSYEDMICEMKTWVITHKSLYPHYFNEGILF